MIIKTKLEIGKFLHNSYVDNTPIVEITQEELESINKNDYIVIDDTSEEVKRQAIQEILNYPPSVKVRGFEEVVEKHKKHSSETIIPTRGSQSAAGYDFYSKEHIIIKPGDKHIFWTDIKAYMMKDEVLEIHVRSSIGIKKRLVLANGTGIIDSDYYSNPDNDGNIGICLVNSNLNNTQQNLDQEIKIGERIAQGIFKNYLVADNITETQKRTGGIGSTN